MPPDQLLFEETKRGHGRLRLSEASNYGRGGHHRPPRAAARANSSIHAGVWGWERGLLYLSSPGRPCRVRRLRLLLSSTGPGANGERARERSELGDGAQRCGY